MNEKLPDGKGMAHASGAVCQDRRGRWRTGDGLTEKQAAFVEYVAQGTKVAEAATRAGYAHRSQDAWRLMRNPAIIAAIRERSAAAVSGLSGVAIRTLRTVMEDETAPAAARVGAARWTLEAVGVGLEADKARARMGEAGEKPLSEMTLAEIEDFVARQEAATDRLRTVSAPTLDADTGQATEA